MSETLWPHPNPQDPKLIEEGRRFSAELDAANKVHRQAQSDIAAKYIRRYSAIGNGEDVPPDDQPVILTRAKVFTPADTAPAIAGGFAKL